MRNSFSGKAVNGVSKLGTSTNNSGLEAYGDGIKALLADPIQFEPYAKRVTTDETKYKPINAVEPEMEGADQGSAAGVSWAMWYYLSRHMLIPPISRRNHHSPTARAHHMIPRQHPPRLHQPAKTYGLDL
jgi:hypothetical protein